MSATEKFCDFMEEYVSFFEAMQMDEKEKLASMHGHNLAQIEQVVSKQQASVMEVTNLEKKRLALQKDAGFEGLTLRELLPKLEDGHRQTMQQRLERLERAVDNIKFDNEKSMEAAENNLRLFGFLDTSEDAEIYSDPRGEQKSAFRGDKATGKKFETKI